MSTRPVIGITTYAQEASWGVWKLPAALIPLDYVDAVERAGGRPVLIPPSEEGVAETLDTVDGIVFSGGADLDPARYGADPHPETDTPQARRDAGEMALLEAALERDLPTLAICRGFQLLNVARGGDLVQHLPDEVGTDEHKQVPGVFAQHPVEVKDGSSRGGHRGGVARQPAGRADRDLRRPVGRRIPDGQTVRARRRGSSPHTDGPRRRRRGLAWLRSGSFSTLTLARPPSSAPSDRANLKRNRAACSKKLVSICGAHAASPTVREGLAESSVTRPSSP